MREPKKSVESNALWFQGFWFQGFIQIGVGIGIGIAIGIGIVDPRPATFDPRRSTGTPAFPTPQVARRGSRVDIRSVGSVGVPAR